MSQTPSAVPQWTTMFARLAMLLLAVTCLATWRPEVANADAPAGALAAVAARVPREIQAMRAVGPDNRYDSKTIFDYLDGGAEVYLSYRMRSCLAREYAAGDLIVTLDLFEMGSAADAFGMFTHDQDGEALPVGQRALLRSGWLSFFKGRFFVSVTATRPSARATILAVGNAAAAAIDDLGQPPDLVARLPQDGLVPRSVRFLRSPVLLTQHLDLGENDPLKIGGDVEVVLGRYDRAGENATLVVARYPTASAAKAAARSVGPRLRAGDRRGTVVVSAGILALAVQQAGTALIDPLVKEAVR
jgi:hypothetical protein